MECRLTIDNLSFNYGNKSIFNNFNYTFESGGIYIIEGCNGCGKTTLFKILVGMENYKSGDIRIENCNEKKNLFSVLWQELPYVDYYVSDMIDIFSYKSGDIELFKRSFGLYSEVFRIKKLMNREFASLSGGEKQKIMLSLVFSYPSVFLLLDEPLNHLDKEGIDSLIKAVSMENEKKRGILIITHHSVYFSELNHRTLLLKRG